jgi:hypothetical protein
VLHIFLRALCTSNSLWEKTLICIYLVLFYFGEVLVIEFSRKLYLAYIEKDHLRVFWSNGNAKLTFCKVACSNPHAVFFIMPHTMCSLTQTHYSVHQNDNSKSFRLIFGLRNAIKKMQKEDSNREPSTVSARACFRLAMPTHLTVQSSAICTAPLGTLTQRLILLMYKHFASDTKPIEYKKKEQTTSTFVLINDVIV